MDFWICVKNCYGVEKMIEIQKAISFADESIAFDETKKYANSLQEGKTVALFKLDGEPICECKSLCNGESKVIPISESKEVMQERYNFSPKEFNKIKKISNMIRAHKAKI